MWLPCSVHTLARLSRLGRLSRVHPTVKAGAASLGVDAEGSTEIINAWAGDSRDMSRSLREAVCFDHAPTEVVLLRFPLTSEHLALHVAGSHWRPQARRLSHSSLAGPTSRPLVATVVQHLCRDTGSPHAGISAGLRSPR